MLPEEVLATPRGPGAAAIAAALQGFAHLPCLPPSPSPSHQAPPPPVAPAADVAAASSSTTPPVLIIDPAALAAALTPVLTNALAPAIANALSPVLASSVASAVVSALAPLLYGDRNAQPNNNNNNTVPRTTGAPRRVAGPLAAAPAHIYHSATGASVADRAGGEDPFAVDEELDGAADDDDAYNPPPKRMRLDRGRTPQWNQGADTYGPPGDPSGGSGSVGGGAGAYMPYY